MLSFSQTVTLDLDSTDSDWSRTDGWDLINPESEAALIGLFSTIVLSFSGTATNMIGDLSAIKSG